MSRHYGTAIEPDQEPDTLEPNPELDEFYEALFWEPDLESLEQEMEREQEAELYYQTHTKDGKPVNYEAERAEYLEER